MSNPPLLSVIVVVHDMRREAPRTLFSLGRGYQLRADAIDYEVIVVENGSREPLDERAVTGLGEHFHYVRVEAASPSPCAALNQAAARSRGRFVTVCIDGARILSPGILHHTALAARLSDRPVVTTLSWHLGDKLQNESIREGYDQGVEDRLLDEAGWQADGYRLFGISCLAASSAGGWFLPLPESNCVTVSRRMFDELGGYDERFRTPGGGLANLDFLKRACELPGAEPVVLLGEGTFHQVHGGVASNAPRERHPLREFAREYEEIRGEPYRPPTRSPTLLGAVPEAALPFLRHSVSRALDGTGAGGDTVPG